MTKKAFTLLSMVVTMMILTAMLMLVVFYKDSADLSHLGYLNEYLLTQSEALSNNENIEFRDGLHFNGSGHVNKGFTKRVGNHNVIIHLGNGYITYE